MGDKKYRIEDAIETPDGHAAMVVSFPLPEDHWLYEEHKYPNDPPAPFKEDNSSLRDVRAEEIRKAARWAIKASTRDGKNTDFDPDAMVQNFIVGMLGYWKVFKKCASGKGLY